VKVGAGTGRLLRPFLEHEILPLKRLFNAKSNRCFDVAVDHGFFNQPGFLQGIEDMRTVVQTLVDAAPDAIQLTLGMARTSSRRTPRMM
jgi:DhnA family fructose-bisphosphate aldolase class Ia